MVQRLVGQRVQRVEDRRILTGRGRYVDDIVLPRMVHANFVRSPYPHARVLGLDVEAARSAPGVVAVLTGAEIAAVTSPFQIMMLGPDYRGPAFHALATDKVRFQGEPVALVIAETRALAEDASELVEVDYEPLEAAASYAAAMAPGAPLLYEELGDNVVYRVAPMSFGDPDAAFAEADRVIEVELVQSRHANVPMETRGIVADYDAGTGELLLHASTQSPQRLRADIAQMVRHPHERLRVIAPDVGGAFGLKVSTHREDVAITVASKQIGRPVKWIEDRNEHLVVAGQAREESIAIRAAVKDDGTLLGFRANLTMDHGAYASYPFAMASMAGAIAGSIQGPYLLRGYTFEATVACTNKAHYVAYRGPWEMETWARERLYDVIAHELGLDPADVRRKTMSRGAAGDAMFNGSSLADVASWESLERALDEVDYPAFRAEQAAARAEGRYLGIGFATFIEGAPGPANRRAGGEQARAKLEMDGHLTVFTPQSPHGQSHETTLAQVAADEMGVPLDHVRIVHGDSSLVPYSMIGTGGSRAATWATGSVMHATRSVKEKVLTIASGMLEIGVDDMEILDGMITPKGVPDKAMPLAQIAMMATIMPSSLPPGIDGLESTVNYEGAGITGSGWSGGTHLCTVEVSAETGRVSILRYLVTEDCGQVINPAIVEGQVRGGVAQGIGGVLYEKSAYDDQGQFLAGTFMDYLVPTAVEIPEIEVIHLEAEVDGEVGFRGVGEGGAIVAPAAVSNAIEDALVPFGARVSEQHLPPTRILELMGVIEG